MKKFLAIMLAAVMLFALAACGGNNATEGNASAGNATEGNATEGNANTDNADSDFTVGAIYITSKTDKAGYTFAHHSGITKAMKDLGLDVDKQLVIVDNIPDTDDQAVLAAVDTLVGEGADVIFGISFGYLNAFAEAAKTYPEVIFSHGTGYLCNDTNFNNYFGRIYQARYLAGIAAGLKSLETGNNNIGYVAAFGTDYAETASGINGFALGAQAANPDAKVYVKVLGNWADEINESAFAKELIESYNCGIISQHCDSAQPQIAAENAGVFGCGYNSDMTVDAPKAHLTAAIWNWDVYYSTAMKAAMECDTADKFVEKMGGPVYYGGLKEGFVDVSPLSENCAAGTAEAIEAVRKLIVNGEWDVFSGVKLSVAADGTVTKSDAALVDSNGNEIVAAGGASVEDSVITGTMNYYVVGVEEA